MAINPRSMSARQTKLEGSGKESLSWGMVQIVPVSASFSEADAMFAHPVGPLSGMPHVTVATDCIGRMPSL